MASVDFTRVPDSVWLEILSYFSSDNLLLWTALPEIEIQKCEIFRRLFHSFHLCGDKSLWKSVDWQGRISKPIILRKLIRFIGPYTTKIKFSGFDSTKKKKLKIPESILHSIQNRATHLKTLELVNCTLDYHETPLRKVPRSIEKITLDNVSWTNYPFVLTLRASPFFQLHKRFEKLKEIQVINGDKWLSRQDRNCLKTIQEQNGCAT